MLMTNQATNNSSGFADTADYLSPPTLSDLNGYYTDGDSADQEVFAEMRSNILLASGEQYNKRRASYFKRIRDSKELNQEQKLRLTKNHIQKICKLYSNNIISMNPNVGFTPKDEKSPHDQKVADLHHSVWRDGWDRYNLDDKVDDWCDSFIQVGEVTVKLFYDPNLGDVKGYEPQVDGEGNPSLNEFQEQVPDEGKPVFSGEFVFEEVYGFNLLRPPECKDLKKAEWLCIRKMVSKKEMLRRFKGNPAIQGAIRTDQDETYMVFDAISGGYKKSVDQTMLREYYFRPSLLFPEGYFYITTKDGIITEGELPGGLFPIITQPFDKIQTTPRGRSPIKTMRPYQVEINRSASKIAEHQITLGDDKLLLQNGTKVSAGASLPGIRGVNYTGSEPKILAGRSGDQYMAYMVSQITELYQVMMVAEDGAENEPGDMYMMMYRSARQKKKFQRYIKRFEKFLIELCKLYLQLAKIHMPDDAVVWAVGKNEQVNIPEFRALPDTCYEVKIEAQADDIETKFGKQIVLNHALQYVGPNMGKDDIGKLLRQMPFANFDESFDDMTMDYDTALNDVLALDRGEQPPINQYDNHEYMIKKLTFRTRKPDFKMLDPKIQQTYQAKISLHQQFAAQNQLAIQQAEQGFIPTEGALITVDFYVNKPGQDGSPKQEKVKLPYTSIDWLLKRLDAQGQGQEALMSMSQSVLAQTAGKLNEMQPQAQPPMGMQPPGMMQQNPPPPTNPWAAAM